MERIKIECRILGQMGKIEVLEQELKNEKEELKSLTMDLEASLREELANILAENERLERELKERQW